MGDVRIVDRQFGDVSDGGTTAAVGDGRSEACARHEVQSIRATSGAHTREIAFAFGPVLGHTAAGLLKAKDIISCFDAERNDYATGEAGEGRAQTFTRQTQGT